MNYEQMIAAKTELTHHAATWGMWSSGVIIAIAASVALVSWRKSKGNDEWLALIVIAGAIALVGLTAFCQNLFDYKTAEVKARADLTNYNLVEIKK